METTNSEMTIQTKKENFMAKSLKVAEHVGEFEMTIKVMDAKIIGTIQTGYEFNLQEVRDIVGDTETTIGQCDNGLEITLREYL